MSPFRLLLLVLAQNLIGLAWAEAATEPSSGERRQQITAAIIGTSPIQGEFVPLLRAELAELGVEVVEEPEDSNTAFTFRILIKPTSLEVWILDRRTGQLSLREVFTQSDGRALDPRTAALHAVELLRWHLTGIEPRLRPSPSQPVEEAATAQPSAMPGASRPGRELSLGFASALLLSPGGLGPGIAGQVDASLRSGALGLRAVASTALRAHALERPEGRAEARSQFLALEGLLYCSAEPTPLLVSLGAGLGVISTELRGVAASGYVAKDDQLLTAGPLLDGRLQLQLFSALRATVGASLLVPARSSELVFEHRSVGTYGRWLLSLAVGLELVLDADAPTR